MTNEKRPEPAATGRGEIQNQERTQIMDETTGTIVAWIERGPEGQHGPLWEVAVERVTADEPWTIYAAFEGASDGHLDFDELHRCASAGYRAEQELMRLTDPERWGRGEMAARHPELIHRSAKPLEKYVAAHTYRCRQRGCTLYGLFHVADDETQVQHTALHAIGRGWELEVATEPGGDHWHVLTAGGRRVAAEDPRDFAAAFSSAERRVSELNGDVVPSRRRGGVAGE
ncbi:hypothetical protein [Curtobacterium citreum]|uniref:hypothetical protein n=1 Tax=Curtobacterium citreum TaxID=2036 RepID=UPI000736E192|nr:hypothetical protein [Curtobacterium citreum]KTR19647.1 hypothetical protein NS330_07320 [Curtobacterium citreum]